MPNPLSCLKSAFVLFVLVFGSVGFAAAQGIRPPQGYIGFTHTFPGPAPAYWNGTQRGHYSITYSFRLGDTSGDLAGTFWSNGIRFLESDTALPPSHVGGLQGGYLGVQVKSPSESIAIFSLWWAKGASPGAGAHCVNEIEAWYADDRPWDPRIRSMAEVDPSRPLAGGPFRSCRLPISLQPGVTYQLRVYETSDAQKPNEPEWWGSVLVNAATGEESFIGALQVPGEWGWLRNAGSGFIEHFGPMPAGCGSIPASSSVYFAAIGGDGQRSTLSSKLYGACESDLRRRTRMNCNGAQCGIEIGR